MPENSMKKPVLQALLAALLYGLNAPFAKLLLGSIPPMLMAALLYLGAGIGMTAVFFVRSKRAGAAREARIVKKDLLWIALIILLDVAAPFFMMWGLSLTTAANASLLFNFEMVATSAIASVFFKEAVGKRVWLALGVITAASLLLSADFSSGSSFSFSTGSLLVLAACACWGLENNCTRNLSAKDPVEIVMVKGFGSGFTALVLALVTVNIPAFYPLQMSGALALGFVSYGLSIFFYVKAQRGLGAARTSMYYAASPFMGVLLSILLLGEFPDAAFWIGAVLMAAGVILAVKEKHVHRHVHAMEVHTHLHTHDDGHHGHTHGPGMETAGAHTHEHVHPETAHSHAHTPDIHHRHIHR
jgi:drug/metabolite transporter (DMT)-like permease